MYCYRNNIEIKCNAFFIFFFFLSFCLLVLAIRYSFYVALIQIIFSLGMCGDLWMAWIVIHHINVVRRHNMAHKDE